MILLLSPAKSQQFEQRRYDTLHTSPFIEESKTIISAAQKLSVAEIEKLMKVSSSIAEKTVKEFQDWNEAGQNVSVTDALSGFTGPAFKGLSPETLSPEGLKRAQESLIILSGLYGVLRADSRFMPYRFEMGLPFKINGISLYNFWKENITSYINDISQNHKAVINCASTEYSKAVDFKSLKLPVITCDFKEIKGDKLRSISSYAKTARGTMARYILENGCSSPEELKNFNKLGYTFSSENSDTDTYCFIR